MILKTNLIRIFDSKLRVPQINQPNEYMFIAYIVTVNIIIFILVPVLVYNTFTMTLQINMLQSETLHVQASFTQQLALRDQQINTLQSIILEQASQYQKLQHAYNKTELNLIPKFQIFNNPYIDPLVNRLLQYYILHYGFKATCFFIREAFRVPTIDRFIDNIYEAIPILSEKEIVSSGPDPEGNYLECVIRRGKIIDSRIAPGENCDYLPLHIYIKDLRDKIDLMSIDEEKTAIAGTIIRTATKGIGMSGLVNITT